MNSEWGRKPTKIKATFFPSTKYVDNTNMLLSKIEKLEERIERLEKLIERYL